MKVVDEKGKLFGKLNLIDLLVIVFIIAALVVVGVKVFGSRGGEVQTTKLTYTVRVSNLDADFAQRVGEYVDKATGRKDQCMANGAMLDAYVVDYWSEASVRYVETADGRVVPFTEDMENGRIDLYFVIEANVGNALLNEVGTQEVRIGKSHIVKTTHFEFTNGLIKNCTWETGA